MTARPLPEGPRVVPSLLSADFSHLADEIRAVAAHEVAILHLDVMDGHFVPNITFGPPLVRTIRRTTDLFLDAHLMIADPLRYAEPFAEAGADLLTLHVEALAGGRDHRTPTPEALRGLERAAAILRRCDCGMGLTFRPGTDPRPWLQAAGAMVDLVLVMTVEPGFGGQSFMEEQLAALQTVAELRAAHGWRYRIEVDGGIDPRTAGRCARRGADWFVAGSAVFGEEDRGRALAAIRRGIEAALAEPGP